MPRLVHPAAPFAAVFASVALIAAGVGGSPAPAPTITAAAAKPAPTSRPLTADSVVYLVHAHNNSLSTYRAHARLDVRQLNFPYLHPVIDGDQYYTAPGFIVVDFHNPPFYLKGINKVEGAALSAPRWRHCYDISLKSADPYMLHLVPKIRGEVAFLDVVVGKTGTIDRIDWNYHNEGDHITLQQTYSEVSGHMVVTQQQSDITLRHIRARGNASFDSFQFGVPVPTPTPTPTNPLHQCDN